MIWGLLDDIWHWHNNKISVYDPANNRVKSSNDTKQSLDTMMAKTNTTKLRASSSSLKPDSIGMGPPKMSDYLRNGSKAAESMRALTPNLPL